VRQAIAQAEEAGLSHLVHFEQGDAEQLPFDANSFDAVICECAFCTFPDKPTAATEFARVLRPGGRVGLSDLTRSGPLPAELEGILAWIACLADARPIDEYVSYLERAGVMVNQIEPHNPALTEMVKNIRTRLLGAEVLVKLKKIELPFGVDFKQAKTLVRHAFEAVQEGKLGYTVVVGIKPVSLVNP
jgi:arsenite methyltransferase